MTPTVPKNMPIEYKTDYYKVVHHLGYRPDLAWLTSYGESRINSKFDRVLWTGLKPILVDHLAGPVCTKEGIEYAEYKSMQASGQKSYFNKKMWEHILNKHGGHLPLKIKAVPEGTIVGVNNVLFTTENTGGKITVPLVNSVETMLMWSWYPTTIATNDRVIKQDIMKRLIKSGTPGLIEFMCHDFGMRGVTGFQQSVDGGMSHLINFAGSDTNSAEWGIDNYYGGFPNGRLKSVWATEHSIATSFGPGEGEYNYVLHQLNNAPPDAIISLVADSYDVYNFCSVVLAREDIKKKIIDRPGRFVVRPDSGIPPEVVNKCLILLGNVFGVAYNDKHYKYINNNVGLLQGDGMDRETIYELYDSIITNGWSADNLVVGSGGGLLQKDFNRDTQRFAIKASYGALDNGEEIVIQKTVATDPTKSSKAGRLKLHPNSMGGFSTFSSTKETPAAFSGYVDALETVFVDGELKNQSNFEDIIHRARLREEGDYDYAGTTISLL